MGINCLDYSSDDLMNRVPGGIGVFNIFPDGRIEQKYLNDGYYMLVESVRPERTDYLGFYALKAVYPDDLLGLRKEIDNAVAQHRDIFYDIRIVTGKEQYKWINVHATIASKTPEYDTYYVLFSDINEIKTLHLQLETSSSAVNIASRQAGVWFWSYYIDRKVAIHNIGMNVGCGYSEIGENIPESMFEAGQIHPEDQGIFRNLFEQLEQDEECASAIVRIKNLELQKFEWINITYTRLQNTTNKERVAIGCAMNVELQQENKIRYEHEVQLRHELLHDAVVHYQMNLSTRIMEVYDTEFPNTEGLKVPFLITDKLIAGLVANIPNEDEKKAFWNTFSVESLLNAYKKGQDTVELEYRRNLRGKGLRWLRGTGRIMKRPSTDELIALIYIMDIDDEMKMKMAMSSVVDEEIEYVVLLNVASKQARIVNEKASSRKEASHREFDFDKRTELLTLSAVVDEDKEAADRFFQTKTLVEELDQNQLVTIAYRYQANGRIFRKTARAFYLDETKEDIVIARRDITDLYEEEERQKNILQQAVKAANVASEAKSEFLSRMSHDIRTPMNAIIGITSLAMDEVENPEAMRDYLEKISSSSRFLLGLVNDCLDMEKIESKKMKLQLRPYTYQEFENAIKTLILPLCSEKNITFQYHLPKRKFRVFVDKVRFEQIFINLLTNAVKYTPEGGTVEFFDYDGIQEGDYLTCKYLVRDNGIGMSKKFQKNLFVPFTQESRSEMPYAQGSGLGLCIVKNIVEMMDGTIQIKSEKGKGTDVYVTVKMKVLEDQPQDRDASEDTREALLKEKHILLVEDHPLNTEIAQKLLERSGMIVTCAANGKIAVDTFMANEKGYFDAILMDIRMPVMDGLEATKQIRALKREDAKSIPIIAMTANAFAEDIEKSMKAGMNRHLAKPIDAGTLISTLREMMIPE